VYDETNCTSPRSKTHTARSAGERREPSSASYQFYPSCGRS
jgi:hypothetical protein